ncbi:HD superfamily phosphodiesterase [Virgibacillus natechei]|uniref:HD superfamily phosphodiesterase n=1 Tax=Virgibacillus natechei TaxID=1216297 RepID=A0ABS4ICY3_9BACI|nr:HD domain-containing protein [Virgibacillus natechei]MBP1967914.1 HD superfamily phosphodiesterase [Virgibacillus natechei]
MDKKKQLQAIEEYVYKHFHDDSTGHDYFHMKRVTRIAKEIAIKEPADIFITESAAWIHDIGDPKLFSNPVRAIEDMCSFLESINIPWRNTRYSSSYQRGFVQ